MEPSLFDTTLPEAPLWSLWTGTAGRVFIWLAILLFATSALTWLLSPRDTRLSKIGARAFTFGSLCLFGAFVVLGTLFATNRLEYSYVWGHGDGSNTLPYRLAGIWAGQQGSFLLWACCAALFGLFAVRGTGVMRRWFTTVYAVFLGSIAAILAYETPFGLNMLDGKAVVPANGVGLSPALQNYWVTIHPPVIFLGFGALTVLAAYALAAMATNRVQEWVPMVRPWALIAMSLTGLGLCMGGFWAYETLGWGGFWMWDPVENVSFVPWILTTGFVHGLMVQVARKRWVVSNLLLGGLPFILFVYGTFLTRSGVLGDTSVHSFADMDHFAQKLLLGFMAGSSLTFLGIWAWRAMQFKEKGLEPDGPPKGFHREGFYRWGNILLVSLAMATAIGMSVPMIMALGGKAPQVVEEGLYHRILVWMYVPLMMAMAVAPLVAWRGMKAKELSKRVYGVICVTAVFIGLSMVAVAMTPWLRDIGRLHSVSMPFNLKAPLIPWTLALVGLSLAVFVASGWRIAELFKRSKISAAAFLSHIGLAVLMAGLIVSRGFERKEQILIQQDSHAVGLGYFIGYKGQTSNDTDRNNKVQFEMRRGDEKWTAEPGFYYSRMADGRTAPMVWPYIQRHLLYDIYFALQPVVTDAAEAVTLKPGETKKIDRFDVTFVKRDAAPSLDGPAPRFGVILKVKAGAEEMNINPWLEVGSTAPKEHPAAVGQHYKMALTMIDPATGAATLQLSYAKPIYPVQLFYKPMTILVWVGTFILGFAGLLSAWYRRRPKNLPEATPEGTEVSAPTATATPPEKEKVKIRR